MDAGHIKPKHFFFCIHVQNIHLWGDIFNKRVDNISTLTLDFFELLFDGAVEGLVLAADLILLLV